MLPLIKSILNEGITHIEDLPPLEFIDTVNKLNAHVITEKLDGANLWFGVDDKGLFTSREGKSPSRGRNYTADSYTVTSNNNGFRAAHLALEKVEDTIKKIMSPGDIIEIEVLFGRQPNTVTYGNDGKNFIIMLRGVEGTDQDKVQKLASALNGKEVKINSEVVWSDDGDEIQTKKQEMVWGFAKVKPIASKKVNIEPAKKMLSDMSAYLSKKNAELPELTNLEVSTLNLGSIPKDERDVAKKQRESVNAEILNSFKLPIKDYLLTGLVRKIKPMLQDKNVHPSEDIGIEGVVITNPETGAMTKIVDRDVFTAINSFNNTIRGKMSGLVRTTDKDAAVEMRGGVFGQAKIRIADLFNASALALSSGVKRYVTKFKKESALETAKAIAAEVQADDNFSGKKTKVLAILKNSLTEIDDLLQTHKNEAGENTLTLKTGKTIGLSPEIMKKTLTSFAETKADIKAVISNVSRSKNGADLINSLYGKTIQSLFDGKSEMNESKSLLSFVENGGVTTSSAIASPEMRFAGKRLIVRRKRNFSKPARFKMPEEIKGALKSDSKSLMASVNEAWADLQNMKYATDVDDSVSGQNDVEFKQLRNKVLFNTNVNQSSVIQYLDKAKELNDEVDTVIFGLELDSGDVVKVYVAANEADKFEKEMAELLGKYDDVEDVINMAAEKFEIVDVEWPEGSDKITDSVAVTDDQPEDSTVEKPEDSTDEKPDAEDSTEEEESQEVESEDEEQAATYTNLRALLSEAVQNPRLATPALKAIRDILIDIGVDPTLTGQSLDRQLKQMERTPRGKKLRMLPSMGSLVRKAEIGISKAVDLIPRKDISPKKASELLAQQQPLPQQKATNIAALFPPVGKQIAPAGQAARESSKMPLISSINEAASKWIFADLESLGLQFTGQGFVVKIANDDVDGVLADFGEGKDFTVTTLDNKEIEFSKKPDDSYTVRMGSKTATLLKTDIETILKLR